MAFFYVKSGGTATGDGGRFASQQTGAWSGTSSEYYESIAAAQGATTPPAAGDFICVSNASAYSASSTGGINGATGLGVNVVCVDNSNRENVAVASSALEWATGGAADYNFCTNVPGGALNCYGIWIKSSDNMDLCAVTGGSAFYCKCTFEIDGSTDVMGFNINSGLEGGDCKCIDCDFVFGSSSAVFSGPSRGARAVIEGGSFDSTLSSLITAGYGAGGGSITFVGVDLSGITTSLVGTSGSADDSHSTKFIRCRLASGVEIVGSGQTLRFGQRVEAYNCGHNASAEYQYYVQEEECTAQSDTSKYRDDSVGAPSGQKYSIKVDTSANVSILRPFFFDLPTTFADLTNSASDTLRYHILSSAALTDADVWMVAMYPDGTNVHIPNTAVSSTLTDIPDAFDPFRTGTTLTSNTESWTGRITENRYQIDIDTSGDPGAKCVPIVRCFVAKPSATLYICSTPELV